MALAEQFPTEAADRLTMGHPQAAFDDIAIIHAQTQFDEDGEGRVVIHLIDKRGRVLFSLCASDHNLQPPKVLVSSYDQRPAVATIEAACSYDHRARYLIIGPTEQSVDELAKKFISHNAYAYDPQVGPSRRRNDGKYVAEASVERSAE